MFADDMILYVENPKDDTRKLLELINEFGKVAGYKINAQKSLALLYINGKKSEWKIRETLPFTIDTKRIKHLGINLPKETKDLYAESYKTLMKEIKDDTNIWRDKQYSWIGRINIRKCLYYPKQSTDSMQSYQTTNGIFHRIRNKIFHNLYETTKDPE